MSPDQRSALTPLCVQVGDDAREAFRLLARAIRERTGLDVVQNDMCFNDTLEADFAELARLYHADPQRTLSCVLPPRRQQGG